MHTPTQINKQPHPFLLSLIVCISCSYISVYIITINYDKSLENYTFSFFVFVLFGTRRLLKFTYCSNQIMKCFVNVYSVFSTSLYITNLGKRERERERERERISNRQLITIDKSWTYPWLVKIILFILHYIITLQVVPFPKRIIYCTNTDVVS